MAEAESEHSKMFSRAIGKHLALINFHVGAELGGFLKIISFFKG